MTEEEQIDKIFVYLRTHSTTVSLRPENFVSHGLATTGKDAERYCDAISDYGFVSLSLVPTGGYFSYRISSAGIHFMDKLPERYGDKPYTYCLKIEKEKLDKIVSREELDDKVKKLTINGAKLQTWVTLGSLIVAFTALFIPFVLRKMDENKINQTEIPQLDTLIQKTSQLTQTMQQNLLGLQKIDSVISAKKK